MTKHTRREFLSQVGAGAIAFVGLQLSTGCEYISVEEKGLAAGEHVPFMTSQQDGIWFWQSGQGITKEQAPRIKTEDWVLRITEGRETLGEIDFATLLEYAEAGHEMAYWKTMRCVFSPAVGAPLTTLVANGIFKGIPLHVVLADMDVPAGAAKMRTYGADGFTSNVRASRALDPGPDPLPVLLAYELNNEPMTRLRGGPVRLIVPEMWGFKNMKWIDRLDFTNDPSPFGNYETVRFPEMPLIDDPGAMALGTVVNQPSSRNAEIQGPTVAVSGIAVVGNASIEAVEVSLDDGPFEVVEMFGIHREDVYDALPEELQGAMEESAQDEQDWPPTNIWVTWRRVYEELSPGPHRVTVRATDSRGRRQSSKTNDILQIAHPVSLEFVVL